FIALFVAGPLLEAAGMLRNVVEQRELGYGEGIVLWQASQVLHLKRAFHPVEEYPHIVFHYTPFYHLVLRTLSAVFGSPQLVGRAISMAAALWLVGLFVWTVVKTTRGYAPPSIRWLGALLAGAYVFYLPSMQFVPHARVDMLGLAMQFTALSLLVVAPLSLGNQIAALCLLLLGVYTKQSFITIPIASVCLLGVVRPARAKWFAGSLLAASLIFFLILAWATDGGVVRHWILYNVNPFSLKQALLSELRYSTNLAGLMATGLAALWLTLPRAVRRPWPDSWGVASGRISHRD